MGISMEQIEERLKKAFPGADILVSGDGTHFEARILATQFQNLSKIKQHQAVMQVFDTELKSGELHALSLKTMPK
jgi:acid stress-induced BolA-like protein IbaG/YrbA